MFAVMMNELNTTKKNEREYYPGLIMCSDSCHCELHGFEIDMDGKIIMPLLSPNHSQDCKNSTNCATED